MPGAFFGKSSCRFLPHPALTYGKRSMAAASKRWLGIKFIVLS
jgi:hypothetical protein